MELRSLISALASGASIKNTDDPDTYNVVAYHGEIDNAMMRRLIDGGWIVGTGIGAKLSDAGLKAYLKSTDELGDGKLIAPKDIQP